MKIGGELVAVVVYLLAVFLFLCWLLACGMLKQRTSAEEAGESATSNQQQIALKRAQTKGLNKEMVDALPTFIYSSNDRLGSMQGSPDHELHDGSEKQQGSCSSKKYCIECPVCLCEFQHEEKGRLLPNCGHRFHLDCIDTWLLFNATCPVCRAYCAESTAAPKDVTLQVMIPASQDRMRSLGVGYPTGVLFWGSSSRVSARVGLDSTPEAPAASMIIQIYTQAQALHATPSLSSSSSSPSPA